MSLNCITCQYVNLKIYNVTAVSELLDIQDVVAHSEIEYARNLVSEPGVDENLKFTFLIQCAAKCLSDNKVCIMCGWIIFKF